MPLPVQARCSGTANPCRRPPGSLLLLLPALPQAADPGRGQNRAEGSCSIWRCTPAAGEQSNVLAIKTEQQVPL